jgi:hypothetical protein
MKKWPLLLVLLCMIHTTVAAKLLIDTPLNLENFLERKENLIGAQVAIAAYFFGPFEGSWICSDKKWPHEYSIKGIGGYEASYFTKGGDKVLAGGNKLPYGYPCYVYGTVHREKKKFYIKLDAIYEVSAKDPEWLAAFSSEQIRVRQ